MTTALTILPAPQVPANPDHLVADELVMDGGTFGQYQLADIRISRTNRKRFNEAKLLELAASIKAKGVAQPILIRPVTPTAEAPQEFEIVAGERRFRASIIAGLNTIPAMCRVLSDLEALELQILENLQRDDPHPLEEAEGYERLMLTHGYNADQLADKLSKSRSYIYGRLKLCALATSVRELFLDDKFNAAVALLIARLPTPAMQAQAAAEIIQPPHGGESMSFRQARDMMRRRYMLDLKHAVFPIKDSKLIEDAGSCTHCPKRTGNQPEIYSDETNGNICTDPDCHAEKVAAHTNKTKALAEARGQTVIAGAAAQKVMPSSWNDLKGGYVDLNKEFYGAGGPTSYSKLLGKNTPEATLLENPFKPGTWLKIAKLHDVEAALALAGIAGPETDAMRNEASRSREKEQEAKAKIERAYRTKLFTEVHHGSVGMGLDDGDLRLVALRLFNQLPGNTISTKLVMSLQGWDEETFSYPAREKQAAAIAALTPDQLNQFIRDCILSHELHVNVYTSYKESDKPNELLAMAERTKVDAKAIKKELLNEAKAKTAAKKAAADKKAAKKAPKVEKAPVAAPVPAPATATATATEQALPPAYADIDVDGMSGVDDITAYITANPGRLDDLTQAIFFNAPLLINSLETAASQLGYTYSTAGWGKVEVAAAEAAATEAEAAATEAEAAATEAEAAPAPTQRRKILKPKAAAPTDAAAPASTDPVIKVKKKREVASAEAWPFPTQPQTIDQAK